MSVPVPAPFLFNAWLLSVRDGDTILARVDRGDRDYSTWPVRLAGLNAIELGRPGGMQARQYLQELLPPETPLVLQTLKPDKYGDRKLATVWAARDGKAFNVCSHLIEQGWAAAWDGRGIAPQPVWPRLVDA